MTERLSDERLGEIARWPSSWDGPTHALRLDEVRALVDEVRERRAAERKTVDFWESVAECSERVKSWPQWKQAGVVAERQAMKDEVKDSLKEREA